MIDPNIERLLAGLDEFRTRLTDWMTSGPNEPVSARSGGVTAEATLASGVVSLEIDDYWLRTNEMDRVAHCARTAITEAEAAAKNKIWEDLGDVRLGDLRFADAGDPERVVAAMNISEDVGARLRET